MTSFRYSTKFFSSCPGVFVAIFYAVTGLESRPAIQQTKRPLRTSGTAFDVLHTRLFAADAIHPLLRVILQRRITLRRLLVFLAGLLDELPVSLVVAFHT